MALGLPVVPIEQSQTRYAGRLLTHLQRVQPPVRTLGVAVLLGWLTDLLFYGKPLGISVPVFILLLAGTLVAVGHLEGLRPARRNLWLLAPLLFFATMVCVRANATLTWLNLAAVASLLGLLVFFYAADRIERLGLMGYPAVVLLAGRQTVSRPVPLALAASRGMAARRDHMRALAPLVRGIALALPILLVFTVLLSSADTFFAQYVSDALQFGYLSDLPEVLWRLLLIMAATWLIAGGLLYATSRRRFWPRADAETVLPGHLEPARRLGFVEAATVLALVDLLFAVFAWTQFAYLFSGHAAATMHFESFRLYARRGFGELLVASVLTLCLILGLRWIASRKTVREVYVLNGLSTLMVGLVAVMLVSAFQRLLVWEHVEYYINTPIRLYVRWFIIWLGLTFGWLVFTLWLRADRFAIGGFVAALGFLVTVNLLNPDADVAKYNLARQDELSTRFLHLLSDDAVPSLVAGLEAAPAAVQLPLREHLR
ncbi:MAG TPA: DUF4173 domain-containing protein, partial [Chloroflexota bacterium]|nr:DUF4173 domain-containing protein [Chloroflexota bacterium]